MLQHHYVDAYVEPAVFSPAHQHASTTVARRPGNHVDVHMGHLAAREARTFTGFGFGFRANRV